MPYQNISFSIIELMLKLVENKDKVRCGSCTKQLDEDNLDGFDYPHDGGIFINEAGEKLWLYLHCDKCEYDTALWKLRIEGLQ